MTLLGTSVLLAPSSVGAVSVTTPWTTMRTPFVTGGSELAGVSCLADAGTDCVAVGGTSVTGPQKEVPLAEFWNGQWSVTPTPSPGTNASFSGVSCGLPDYCMAVGTYRSGTFAELWNGVSWSMKLTSSGAATLTAVSCQGKSCVAVGSDAGAALAEHWSGNKWTQLTPESPGKRNALFGVSCVSNQCLAVGAVYFGPEIAELLKQSWTLVSPAKAAQLGGFYGEDCARATIPLTCMAVGMSNVGCGCPIAQLWNESTGGWTNTGAFGSTDSWFNGVSCPTVSWCVAVGAQYGEFYPTDTLAEAWNGARWIAMTTPPDKQNLPFTSVSCPTSTFCVTVGSKVVLTGGSRVLQPEVADWGTPP